MTMRQIFWAALAGLLLAGSGVAADDGLAGNWKLNLFLEGQHQPFWLLQLQQTEGKWTGKVLAKGGRDLPLPNVTDIRLADGLLRFALKVDTTEFTFEGRLPQEQGKPILGSLLLGSRLVLVEMERTKLTTLDPYELTKEDLAKATHAGEIFGAAMALLGQAAEKKAKPEEVRSWAEKAYKAGEAHGPRQQREIAISIADTLAGQEGLAEIAVGYARRAERMLEPRDRASTQRRVLQVLATALNKAGKSDEAREVEARLAKIAVVRTTPYPGRKGQSDRIVLVELFTGAQCPPCVATDLAFDALEKSYKPTEVVLLQYHQHIPGPDPLTNPDSEDRLRFYRNAVEGTPTILFNGRPDAEGGGGMDAAQDKYDEYRQVIDALLEKPAAKARLTASAVRKGNKIDIAADASGVEESGDKVRLRLALVEDQVTYKGRNGLEHHHHVVRALPGGTSGVPVKDRAAKQSVSVDLDELKKNLKKYLDDWAKENDAFPGKEASMDLKNLRLVAFLQNDATKEVLQAVQVPVTSSK
jgi:hypothetical protein